MIRNLDLKRLLNPEGGTIHQIVNDRGEMREFDDEKEFMMPRGFNPVPRKQRSRIYTIVNTRTGETRDFNEKKEIPPRGWEILPDEYREESSDDESSVDEEQKEEILRRENPDVNINTYRVYKIINPWSKKIIDWDERTQMPRGYELISDDYQEYEDLDDLPEDAQDDENYQSAEDEQDYSKVPEINTQEVAKEFKEAIKILDQNIAKEQNIEDQKILLNTLENKDALFNIFDLQSGNKFKRLTEVKLDSSYPIDVKNEIKLMSISRDGTAIPFGSYIYRIQKYPGDVDLLEKFNYSDNRSDLLDEAVKGIKRVVKNIVSNRLHYFSEIKAGFDERFNIDIGSLVNGKFLMNNDLFDMLEDIESENLFDENEYATIIQLLEDWISGDDTYTDSDIYDIIENVIRGHKILRWTPKEILRGMKQLPGGETKTLKDALRDPTMLKIDEITLINGHFTEVTNIIELSYTNGSGNTKYVNIQMSKMNNIDIALPKEIEKLYFSDYHYNPFKMIKRIFSFARHTDNHQLLEKIFPIISSDISAMYQIKSELEAIKLVLENFKSPPIITINKQLDYMKNALSRLIELSQRQEGLFNDALDQAVEETDMEKKIYIIDKVIFFLKKKINFFSLDYLNKVGLNPPPQTVLPAKRRYGNVLRNPNDYPLNLMQSVGLSGGCEACHAIQKYNSQMSLLN